MDITFADLKRKVILLLADEEVENSDPVAGSAYNAGILQDAVHAALNAICSRLWREDLMESEEGIDAVELPADVIDVETVYDKSLGIFIPRIQMQIGQTLTSTQGNAWHRFPTGILKLINTASKGVTIYYSARWTKPEDDDEAIEPPDSALTCLILYAASYCLLSDASASASVRQFNTKVDSGVPSDIPAKVISDFLLGRFERELQRIPMGEKVRNQ